MNTTTIQTGPAFSSPQPDTADVAGLAATGETKLHALCEHLGASPRQSALALQTFRKLTRPWLAAVPAGAPAWRSDITDDHSPFEFSVSMGENGCDVRLLVEAQDGRMDEHQGWDPAVALTRSLAGEPGVSLERFDRILDLFAPDPRCRARFSLWHAAAVPAEGPALYKVYFNPQVLGAAGAPDLVREAFDRLGLQAAWPAVEDLLRLPAERNEILYIALDLTDGADARVKVYVAHHGVRAPALEGHLRRLPTYQPGEATRLTRVLAGSEGPFRERPVLTCLGFVAGRPAPEVTLHLPVRCYTRHDGQVVERLVAAVGGQAGADLAAAIGAFAGRPLEAGRGLVTYVSLRGAREGTRVVAYLSPEVYQVEPPRPEAPAPDSEAPVATMLDVLDHVSRREAQIARHPFIQRLEQDRIEDPQALVRGLTFFVMAFQDVLRLGARQVTDPRLVDIARNHQKEDSGHDSWFLHDLRALGVDVSLGYVFSSRHEVPRDVGYALVAEVLRATDDCDRLAVVFALEAIGHVFFEPAIAMFERRQPRDRLLYFARHHQQVEQAHEMFEQNVQQTLAGVGLSRERLAGVCATVDRTFEQMSALADDLVARLETGAESAQAAATLLPERIGDRRANVV